MKTSDFDFDLPEKFIAQDPASPRDHCRLMVFNTSKNKIDHIRFYEIGIYLDSNDVLVVNRTKVNPARVLFDVNGSEKEIFILNSLDSDTALCLVRPGKFFPVGKIVMLEGLELEVLKVNEDGKREIKFSLPVAEVLNRFGNTPLPPYIKHSLSSDRDYQTVFAKESGSVAAPTAGLHFTEKLLDDLKDKGITLVEVLLSVGLGTFLPVSSGNISEHKMHSEEFSLEPENANVLNKARNEGRRIVAVGTTSVRVLESSFCEGKFKPQKSETDIFIYPGSYSWKCVDRLITNFHLPKSSLIMLVASFLEHKGIENPREKVLELYAIAKENDYRFYSFGDAMLII